MLAWLAQASFIITAFLLIPLVVFVLYNQATSIERLEAFGISPHPAIKHATGIVNGQGENPIWTFDVNDETQQILDYYRASLTNSRWEKFEDNYLYLRYRNAGQILMIASTRKAGVSSLIILVSTSHER